MAMHISMNIQSKFYIMILRFGPFPNTFANSVKDDSGNSIDALGELTDAEDKKFKYYNARLEPILYEDEKEMQDSYVSILPNGKFKGLRSGKGVRKANAFLDAERKEVTTEFDDDGYRNAPVFETNFAKGVPLFYDEKGENDADPYLSFVRDGQEMILPSIEPLMTGQALVALVFRSVKMVTIGNY